MSREGDGVGVGARRLLGVEQGQDPCWSRDNGRIRPNVERVPGDPRPGAAVLSDTGRADDITGSPPKVDAVQATQTHGVTPSGKLHIAVPSARVATVGPSTSWSPGWLSLKSSSRQRAAALSMSNTSKWTPVTSPMFALGSFVHHSLIRSRSVVASFRPWRARSPRALLAWLDREQGPAAPGVGDGGFEQSAHAAPLLSIPITRRRAAVGQTRRRPMFNGSTGGRP